VNIVNKITTEENRVIHPLMSKRHNDVIKEKNVKNLKLDFRGFYSFLKPKNLRFFY